MLNSVEFCTYAEKDPLYFDKISANQTFNFINSEVVYFKKHLGYQV